MQYVGRALIEAAGHKAPCDLGIDDVRKAFNKFADMARTTQYCRATLMRRMLRDLRDEYGIPRLWQAVPKLRNAPPRDVTYSEEEKAKLLAHANPHMELLIRLCSDLAIRSGTAVKIAPEHYDRQKGRLTFTTKSDARVSLPVTRRIAELLERCSSSGDTITPFIEQLNPRGHAHINNLRQAFRRLCKRAGIERRVILHDLRRTTAVKVLELTHDLRQVQATLGHSNLLSTMHYLDHRNTTVHREMLEEASASTWEGKIQ